MKLTKIESYEIQAFAFRVMTGYMAPGKDASPLADEAPYEERCAAFDEWRNEHAPCILAMLHGFEALIDRDGEPTRALLDRLDAAEAENERLTRAENLQRAVAEARAKALEDAAKLCDRFAEREMHPAECAAAIRGFDVRALKDQAPQPAEPTEAQIDAALAHEKVREQIAERKSQWIPVSDRLPEPDEPVLCHNGKWTGVGAWVSGDYLEDIEHWQDEHRDFIEMCGPAVSHWMPLPQPPVTQENE